MYDYWLACFTSQQDFWGCSAHSEREKPVTGASTREASHGTLRQSRYLGLAYRTTNNLVVEQLVLSPRGFVENNIGRSEHGVV